jgi:hypothetical protein
MNRGLQRPGGQAPGAEGTVFGEDSNHRFNYTTPACTCHERRPCWVCTAWGEYYRGTQAAVKALGLAKGGRQS